MLIRLIVIYDVSGNNVISFCEDQCQNSNELLVIKFTAQLHKNFTSIVVKTVASKFGHAFY